MTVDRRKSPKTKRHELGFQLTIEWCVKLTICLSFLFAHCSAFGDNVQKIRKRSDEDFQSTYEASLYSSESTTQNAPRHESTTQYELLGTPEKLISNEMDPWKVISFAIQKAKLIDDMKVEASTNVQPYAEQINQYTEKYKEVDPVTVLNVSDETTTILDLSTTVSFDLDEITNFYGEGRFDIAETTHNPELNWDKQFDTTTEIETTTYSVTTTIKPESDQIGSFSHSSNSTKNNEPLKLIDANHINKENSVHVFNINDNINQSSKLKMSDAIIENSTKTNQMGLDSTTKKLNTFDRSTKKPKNTQNSTEKSSNKNKNRRRNSNNPRRSNNKKRNSEINEEMIKKLNVQLDRSDSGENKIEDTFDGKLKTINCLNCNTSSQMTNKTEEVKHENKNVSSMQKNIIHTRENVTEKSTTTTEDDYNVSYEIEDSDEDLMIIKAKKNATEEPLSFGPLNNLGALATGFIESLYERVIPKGVRDIVRRLQEQNEKLETYNLRSKEENGGLGQFGRSIIKGLSGPINQVMQGVRDFGSLDSDRNFLAGVASGVVSIADSVGDSFRERVRAIYPGTLWCGDGHMAHSAEVGWFFMTDSCCQRHDSCKYYISAGQTKFGLTNTGIFTRSHCECDKAFYRCLKKTNSLVSSQIGLTYFSILGPQCFRREYPIIKCARRTRVTGQKCEEYLLDYTQPKMWQWFDNETF